MHLTYYRMPYSFFATCALIGGIWWQAKSGSPLIPLLLFLIITAAILFIRPYTLSFKKIASLILLAVLFLIGSVRYHQQQENFHSFYISHKNDSFDLIGTVCAIDPGLDTKCSSRLTIQVSKIKPHNSAEEWNEIAKTITIYTGTARNLDIADNIMLTDIVFKKSNNQSFNSYLIKEKNAASLFIHSLKHKRLHRPAYSAARCLSHYKTSLLNRLKQKLSRPTFQFFAAIFLGNPIEKRNLKETKQAFKEWGILHHLARSGLHLVLFVLLWQLLLRHIPLSFLLRQLFLIFIIIIYSLLSWTSIPFARALLTFMLYKTGTLLKFQSHLLHLLSLICLITLINNPIQLFFLDFQLSFGITCVLSCFNVFND